MRTSFIVAALAFFGAHSAGAAILVTVLPSVQTVAPGNSAAVQIRISGTGLDVNPSLGAFDFNLAFDPSVVAFTGVTFGDPVLGDQLDLSGTGAIDDFTTPSAGLVEFFEISLDPATTLDSQQADTFTLATLQFLALTSGTSPLSPSLNSVSDSQGSSLSLGLQAGGINVAATSVPEPGGFAFAAGAGISMATWLRLKELRSNRTL